MLLLSLLACGSPFDRYGGGSIEFTFTADGVGFDGTTTAPGSPDVATLREPAEEREGLVGELLDYGDEPVVRQLYANGTGAAIGLTDVATGGAVHLELYGDWLSGSELGDIGAGASVEYASLRIADEGYTNQYWGTWELAEVTVTVSELSGEIAGPMAFSNTSYEAPSEWTQDVRVTWSFDASIHVVDHSPGAGSSASPVPTF